MRAHRVEQGFRPARRQHDAVGGPMADYIDHRRIGGTLACVLAKGEHFGETLYSAWRVLRGEAEPEDLTWKLAPQIGLATEAVNARFFTFKSKIVVDCTDAGRKAFPHELIKNGRDRVLNVSERLACCVTQLDGMIRGHPDDGGYGVWEAKHTSERASIEQLLTTYYPQLQHEMFVTGARYAYLSAIFGNSDLQYERVERNDDWIEQMIPRYEDFWRCVQLGLPPSEPTEMKPPVDPKKTEDLTGSNSWGAAEAEWLEHRAAAKKHAAAEKDLKALAPADAALSFGKLLEVRRDRAGKARIYERSSQPVG